jgi:hypothetical protein
MHLAYEYGVRDIWIVNVGDIKPMEFPISFWLDYAWNPEKIKAEDLQKYTEQWAAKQFGSKHASDIADIISKYTKYNGRRKPELLDATTYSLSNYNEAQRVTADYNKLLARAEKINNELPIDYRDAFFELVLHPVKACENLNELYLAVAKNKIFANSNSPLANEYADKARLFYIGDSLISLQYNNIANGKWNHMMDQTHIGYTYWQQPPRQKMPDVKYVSASPTEEKTVKIEEVTLIDTEKIDFENIKQNSFYEMDGFSSIFASHYNKAINSNNIKWKIIPDIGRDGDGITTFPVTAAEQTISANSPHLEYEIYTYDSGNVKLNVYFSPTLNFRNDSAGLKYGISVDNEAPQIISINKDDNNTRIWEQWVANNIIIKITNHSILKPGKHIIKYWMISPAVVLQKIVVDLGGLKPSYLGPPETRVVAEKSNTKQKQIVKNK